MAFLKLRVHAASRRSDITAKSSDTFEIYVRAPAEQGRANREALSLLAAQLGVPVGRIRLVKGAHSPSKIVALDLEERGSIKR